MKTVAVTGGIGSGKSAVCGILSERGIPVYDCDAAAKRLYARDDSLLDSIEAAFGCSIRLEDGSLNAPKLASIVFPAPEKLKILESIVHPAVLRDFNRWNALQRDRFEGEGASGRFFGKDPFCVMESAIILEKPSFLEVIDRVVMVDASLPLRLKRACERDGSEPEKVIQRMAAQHFDLSKVDIIVRNDGTQEQLASEVEKAFRGIML